MRSLITHLEFSGIILFSLYLFLKQAILFFSLEVMIIILFFCLSIYLPHRTTNAEESAQCSAPAAQVRTWCLTAELRLGPEVAQARTCCTASPPKAQRRVYQGEPKEDIQMATEAMQRSSGFRERQIKLQ